MGLLCICMVSNVGQWKLPEPHSGFSSSFTLVVQDIDCFLVFIDACRKQIPNPSPTVAVIKNLLAISVL